DQNRVELRAVGRAVLVAAAPRLAFRMIVEAVDADPGRAAVGGAEQSLRRSAGVPDAGFRRVSRRQPERMIGGAAAAGLKRGRMRGLFPRSAAIGRAKNRRPEMTGARGGENGPRVARISDRMMHDMSEEIRAGEFPR